MSVKRSFATGRVSHLNHDKLPIIVGQWKTFENLASDTPGNPACWALARPSLLSPIGTLSSQAFESLSLDQIAVRMTMGAPRRSNKVPERQFYLSALGHV
jgi:hypothetical protein